MLLQADAQVWSALKAKLASLQEVQAKVTETTLLVNGLQKQWNAFEGRTSQQTDEDHVDDEQDDERTAVQEKLLEALGSLHDQSEEEKVSVLKVFQGRVTGH